MIISLAQEREKRQDHPDNEFVMLDDDGVPMYTYCLEYKYKNGIYNTRLWAYSFEDAELRVCAMRASLEVSGQLYEVV